jgi:hypothetical protein
MEALPRAPGEPEQERGMRELLASIRSFRIVLCWQVAPFLLACLAGFDHRIRPKVRRAASN